MIGKEGWTHWLSEPSRNDTNHTGYARVALSLDILKSADVLLADLVAHCREVRRHVEPVRERHLPAQLDAVHRLPPVGAWSVCVWGV